MLSDSLLDELSSFAVELAEIARREVMPFWRKRGLPVQSKLEPARPTAESPVTAADRNAEAAMREKIGQRYPSHGILGEEMGAEKADAEFCWVLDPIDGTKSFITGERTRRSGGRACGLQDARCPLAGLGLDLGAARV